MPNLGSWRNRLLLLFGFHPEYAEVSNEIQVSGIRSRPSTEPKPAGHIRLYTLKALTMHLQYIGFKIVGIYGVSSGFEHSKFHPVIRSMLGVIDQILSLKASLAQHIVIFASK